MQKKTSIGIITFWGSEENYGQLLQMYALQTYLNSNGYYSYLIKYNKYPDDLGLTHANQVNKRYRLLKALNPILLLKYFNNKYQVQSKNIKRKKERKNHPRGFEEFINKHINSTLKIYNSISQLKNDPPQADVLITGSDVVWIRFNPAFYLDFGAEKTKRISFAASFGRTKITEEESQKIKPLLQKFDLITTREPQGVKICSDLGRSDAKLVLDPTFLLSINHYKSIAEVKECNNQYCFLYMLGHKTNYPKKEIFKKCKEQNLKIFYACSDRFDNEKKIYPTINEWLGFYQNAELVITNSYHGCIFSIIFNKNFIFLPLIREHSSLNVRVETLLERLGLNDRIFKDNLNEIIKNKINYDQINKVIDAQKYYMITLLKKELDSN